MAKGQIARYELSTEHSHSVFKKLASQGRQKVSLCGNGFRLFMRLVYISCLKPFPKRQILDSSKLKEFADDNFRFDKNGRKFSKQVESTVGKGEIARYEQFLPFPQCFQKTCTADTQKPGLVWERVIE